jgi:drug/metabolite transporter (DMT)-like permease
MYRIAKSFKGDCFMILIILAYAIIALTFPLAKDATLYAKPVFFIGFRMICAGLLMLTYLLVTRKKDLAIKRHDYGLFFRVAATHIYIAFICEFWALSQPTIQSSKVNIIYSSTPFIAALLAYYLLNERLTQKKYAGLLIGVAGLIPIILLQSEPFSGEDFFRISLPEVSLLVAVCSASYAWFDIKKLMTKGYSLFAINGYAMLIGGIGAFVTSMVVEGNPTQSIFDMQHFLLYIMLLIIISNVIFYNLYGYLLKTYSITFLTFAGFLSPVFGAFFGWVRGERITWHYFLSLALITLALYLFSQDENRKKKKLKAMPEIS